MSTGPPQNESVELTLGQNVVEFMRVMVVAGIAAGVVLIGVGSRVAMLVLRLTSPDRVIGVVSDDGFSIGKVTLTGSYNLLLLGAGFGIIGAGAYRLVAPRLIGPTWFRRFTTGAAAGVVVGSMLIHADGIDFTLLKPTWLAIGLFIALPALFGTLVGVVVDSVARQGSWTSRGRTRWLLPALLLAAFPPAIPVVLFATLPVIICFGIAALEPVQRMRGARPFGLIVQAVWLGIAVLGLLAIVADVRDIA